MKKILCILLCIAATTLSFVGCKKPAVYNNSCIGLSFNAADIDNKQAMDEGLYDYLNFTANFLNNSNGKNVLTAPYPAYSALGMVMNGAAGNTLKQANDVLGGDMNQVNSFCLSVSQEIKNNKSKTQANVANSIWINQPYRKYVKESYLKEVSGYYEPEIYAVTFDKSALNQINNWVYNKTDGQIKRILDDFSKDAELILMSALYINGRWTEDVKKTVKNDFKDIDGNKTTAEYFSGKSTLYYSKNAYAVRRYLEGGMFLLAIMPNGDFNEYASNFNGDELNSLLKNINPRGATYDLPEYKTDYEASIIETLQKMGMTDAFINRGANFSALTSEPDGLFISNAKQKSTIEVNSHGLKAAAVVVIEMDKCTSVGPQEEQPLHISFNKPFMYAVCTQSGVPLLIGKTVTM